MDKILSPFKQSKLLNTLFLSNIFLSLHYALIIYINSSYLSNFFSESQISALYIISAVIATVILLYISRVLQKFGNYRCTIFTIIVELICTVGMFMSKTPWHIGLFFLVHSIAIIVLYFNMDIFVESVSTDESQTGSIRATYMTMANLTILISPALVALLLMKNDYSYVYTASAICIIPLYYLTQRFRKLESKKIRHINVRETIMEYVKDTDLFNIFTSSFLLQLFYSIMVIYVPLYLNKYVGFSWSEIGIMFTIMLLPFVLLELPIGELEDGKFGEKGFLTVGFVIMGLSTLFISFITTKSFWIWTTILFLTRIGASFVEVSTESYFFKLVDQQKTDIISFFRISRPLSFVVAPLLATIILQFIPFEYLFIIIGLLMVLGVRYSLGLRDTA